MTLIVLGIALFTINYFTLFGYYLPHQRQVIYTWESNDIFAREEPMYIAITETPLPLIIKTLYSWYGIDNLNREYVIIIGGDDINFESPPEGFPLKTEIKNDRLLIYVPFELSNHTIFKITAIEE